MAKLQEIFCNNIKHFRVLKSLSQLDLAERAGIGQTTLSRLENGKVEPGLGSVEKIAKGLDISPSELFSDPNSDNVSLREKLERIESLGEYDQKIIEAILESYLEKNRLTSLLEMKMKKRLEELERVRKK
ncbi:MAG: hypothetical protein COB12_04815 [Flavobacterium sp.]|nr:MAG: hypothetical protein COB12_04815 [Flavobacterium sp.]